MFGILRTVLAFMVVLLHLFDIHSLGNYAVHFFFVLSGFLMTLVVHSKYGYSGKGFKLFWTNRILRLYPSYWIITGLTVLLLFIYPQYPFHPHMYLPEGVRNWFYNLFMVYPDVVPYNIKPRLSPPTWAITTELIFYMAISLGFSKTLKRTLVWAGISVIYVASTYYAYDFTMMRYSAIPAGSLPFSLGALLYHLLGRLKKPGIRMAILGTIGGFVLFLINGKIASNWNGYSYGLNLYLNTAIAICTIYFAYHIRSIKFRKIDQWIGYFSYPIYLCHYQVAIVYYMWFQKSYPSYKLPISELLPFSILMFGLTAVVVVLIDRNIDKLKSSITLKAKSRQSSK